VPPQEITNGDVILFGAGDETRVEVVHRVNAVVTINLSVEQPDGTLATTSERVFRTKGDANPAPDTWQVDSRNLEGRAYAVLTGLGWPLLEYPVASVFGVLAAGLGAAWAGYELVLARRRRAVRVEAAVPVPSKG
jgi:hypothetical protein